MKEKVILFLREWLNRFFVKSPAFFKIWQVISTILLVISGAPYVLNYIQSFIVIPSAWSTQINLIISCASSGALFMSSMTAKSEPIVPGYLITETNVVKLPFTAVIEKEVASNQ